MFLDPSIRTLDCAGRELVLDRPRIMGIINVTPDSFSDGGRLADADAALARGLELAAAGADILDVGGESTRPGALPVAEQEELDRVIPVIERLARECALPVSVDTSKPGVMRAAVAVGAGMINDVNALRAEGAMDAAVALRVPVCLMHMQGDPRTMQDAPDYDDVVGEVRRFLAERVFACEMAGIDKKRIVIDPGFGFGKTLQHNLMLLARLDQLAEIGVPVLAGLSRKSMIAAMTGRDKTEERVAGSVAAALIAAQRGAAVLRVHDVAETRDALAVLEALRPLRPKTRAGAAPTLSWDED